MNRRLDTRVDSTSRAQERIEVKPTSDRIKQASPARTAHKKPRTQAHAAPKGANMDYQMGFTSGPSV